MSKKNEREYESHPSYGMAVFHRTQGTRGPMFGSRLTKHHTTVRLTIAPGEVCHDLAQDWFHMRGDLHVEVEFSAAQFAELLTTMNCGAGVPCTVLAIRGERVKQPDEPRAPEHEKIVDGFKNDVAELAGNLRTGRARLAELFTKKSLTKDDKHEIDWILGKALQDVESNAPFVLEQFQRATQKTVTVAKAEMDAAITTAAMALGIERLKETATLTPQSLAEMVNKVREE